MSDLIGRCKRCGGNLLAGHECAAAAAAALLAWLEQHGHESDSVPMDKAMLLDIAETLRRLTEERDDPHALASVRQERDEYLSELVELRAEVERAKRATDAWMETARLHCRNEDYYRGLLDQCAPALGEAVYIADDGSRQQDPLRSKVPELVTALRAVAERLREENTQLLSSLVTAEALTINHEGHIATLTARTTAAVEAMREAALLWAWENPPASAHGSESEVDRMEWEELAIRAL